MRPRARLGVVAQTVVIALLCCAPKATQAFVRSVDDVGHPLRWPAMPISYKKNIRGAPDVGSEFAAVDAAFATWSAIPNSAAVINNAGTTSSGANVNDLENTVVWIEDPSLTGGGASPIFSAPDFMATTRTRSDGSGNILEADILLNGIFYSWTSSGTDGFTGKSGPLDIQAIVTHEIGHLLGLDHATSVNSTMFYGTYPGDTSFRSLSQDEISAAQAIYPSAGAPPNSSISGRVTRAGNVGVSRALAIAFQSGRPVVGTMADSTGNYRIDRVPPGSYQVRLQPYSRATAFGQSTFYRSAANVDVDFLSQIYSGVAQESTATPVSVVAGTDTPNINFTASASGNMDDPFEQDDAFSTAKAIGVSGQAHLKHAWPASESDWVTFSATAGRIYVVQTKNLGVARDNTSVDSATIIELYDQTGAGFLGGNGSPNNLEQNNSSRLVRLETATATRYARVYQRPLNPAGAGVVFDVTVNELIGPFAVPVVSSVSASQATEDGDLVVAVHGSNFIPGAEVTLGGSPGTEEDVQDCATPQNCQTIKVRVPAHSPGAVTVQVTNLDGGTGGLASGFTYVSRAVGTFAYWTPVPFGNYIGSGNVVCWGDYDDDGDPDVYVPFTRYQFTGSGELWQNNGDGTFTDVTVAAGLDTSTVFRSSCAWGDFDNDGKLDLYVVYSGVGALDRLYHNNGNGTFTNVATSAGVTGCTGGKSDAAWADYDLDGDLDLYLVCGTTGTPPRNQLFRNNGNNTFTDVAVAAKLDASGAGRRAIWADYDNNGWPDLYLLKTSGQPDILFHNNGDGTFSDVTAAAGIVEGPNCFDAVWADFNNDQRVDLLCIGDSLPGSQPQRYWINQGNGTFVDQAAAAGLNGLGRHGTAVTVLDKDNDGDVDVYLGCSFFSGGFPNAILDSLLQNNLPSGTFTNVSSPPGATPSGVDESTYTTNAASVAAADFDGDGLVDILTAGTGDGQAADDYLWHGTSNTNRSITVRLNGTLSNRWGIGAEVVVIPDLPLTDFPTEQQCLDASSTGFRQEVIGGSLNQNSIELEFGLGTRPIDSSQVDCVDVYWPRSGLRRGYPQVALENYVAFTETAPDLRVTKVAPSFGTTLGGSQVTVFGFNFDAAAQVFFDNISAGIVSRQGTSVIVVTTPANAAGPADVKVQNPIGSPATLVGGYTFVAPGQEIDLRVAKDVPNGKVNLTWTDATLRTYYRVRRAGGPQPADFSPAQLCTIVGGYSYSDPVLNDGASHYYLVDTTLTCP